MNMTIPPPLVIIELSHFVASVSLAIVLLTALRGLKIRGCFVNDLPILTLDAVFSLSLLWFSLLSQVVCVDYPGLDSYHRLMLTFVLYVFFFCFKSWAKEGCTSASVV